MTIIPEPDTNSVNFALNADRFVSSPLIGLTDYGADMEALADACAAVTDESRSGVPFARQLLAFCDKYHLTTLEAEYELMDYQRQRDGLLRLCRVVTFQAGV